MALRSLPPFPYGAVYYRRSNPPERDWERDYETAAADGMNAFRHWFLWGAIEVKPGESNWEPYDRQLDLAAENGMKTVIAEMVTSAPEWIYRRLPHAMYATADGRRLHSEMGGSSSTGGFPGLCLDNPDAQEAAGNFLRELATRYRDHPGLGGYDIWNECNIRSHLCYCEGTQDRFREWLRVKYRTVEELGEAWRRYSFDSWADVEAPRTLGPYPDTLDWLQFRIDNAYRLMRWRHDLIRGIDPEHAIVAHGIAATLSGLADRAADDWRAAAEVEAYGYTWGSSRHGDEPWKQYHAVDLVRAASRGKPYWHAESYAGPLWLQPQVLGKPRDEGRIAKPEDIRLWDAVSLAGGARGIFRLRWRPLLDGPLFGAFGGYGMDGSRTPRSEMVRTVGSWIRDHASVLDSRPIRGDIGILIVPETQIFSYAQRGTTVPYATALEGAYKGFFDNNIQADWLRLEQLDEVDVVYLPFPMMLSEETAARVKQWVRAGGILITEGCPAYFGDQGHVGEAQPNYGMDELFGATESYVEFTPDLLEDLVFSVGGQTVRGGQYLQAYAVTMGTVVGTYPNGSAAAVSNAYGKGRTLLVGSCPGYGHGRHPEAGCAPFFGWVLAWAGKTQHVTVSDPRLTARLQEGPNGYSIWITNPSRVRLTAQVEICSSIGAFQRADAVWGQEASGVDDNRLSVTVDARDAVILELSSD